MRSKIGLRPMSSKVALKNLSDIAHVLEDHGCLYSITSGTLLGAVRNCDFIGHDTDTDLMLPIDTFDPLVLRDLAARGFHICKALGYPDDGMEIGLERRGEVTDLFFLYPRREGHPRSVHTYFSVYGNVESSFATWIDYVFPEFEYGWLDFKGQRFRAPRNPEFLLSCLYGEEWRTPVTAWDYTSDPPNSRRREELLDVAASREALTKYFVQKAGARLIY